MSSMVLKSGSESYWEKLADELAILIRDLSNQPRKLWEQMLSAGSHILEKCQELNLSHLSELLNRFMDYIYDTLKALLQSLLEAMEEIVNGITNAVTQNLPPWLKDFAELIVREVAKAGIDELMKQAVDNIIEYIKEHWPAWSEAALSVVS